MRCCDCEFRKDCSYVEDDVSFSLCGARMEYLYKIEEAKLKEKLERFAREDMKEKKIE